MDPLAKIKLAEQEIETGKAHLAQAVADTFTKGCKVLVKGPRGEKETQVLRTDGEDLYLQTSSGEMKRHYSVVKLA